MARYGKVAHAAPPKVSLQSLCFERATALPVALSKLVLLFEVRLDELMGYREDFPVSFRLVIECFLDLQEYRSFILKEFVERTILTGNHFEQPGLDSPGDGLLDHRVTTSANHQVSLIGSCLRLIFRIVCSFVLAQPRPVGFARWDFWTYNSFYFFESPRFPVLHKNEKIVEPFFPWRTSKFQSSSKFPILSIL